jgi:hypothetical protein
MKWCKGTTPFCQASPSAAGHPVDHLVEFLKVPCLNGCGVPLRLPGQSLAYKVTACHW